MPNSRTTKADGRIIAAAIDLFRSNGYVATTVDEICSKAGVTKGAFFHHFESKEALAEACLGEWNCRVESVHSSAAFQSLQDPTEKLIASIDHFIRFFEQPGIRKSCLAGTIVQEVNETNPRLRDAAHTCFETGEKQFQTLLDDACHQRGIALDTTSLAKLWIATIQGSLVLQKASQDASVLPNNLRQFRQYLRFLLRIESLKDQKP